MPKKFLDLILGIQFPFVGARFLVLAYCNGWRGRSFQEPDAGGEFEPCLRHSVKLSEGVNGRGQTLTWYRATAALRLEMSANTGSGSPFSGL